MTDDIKVNNHPVVISVSHITIDSLYTTFKGRGTRLIKECHTLEEVSAVINNPANMLAPGWEWDIQFQDAPKYIPTVDDVKLLRMVTGEGMLACKKALFACNGDLKAAEEYLHTMGNLCLVNKEPR
jgi:hypothetical protein